MMSKDLAPSSPIAIKFQHDLQLSGMRTRTQQSYVRALRKFSEFLARDPDIDSEDDLTIRQSATCNSRAFFVRWTELFVDVVG